MSKKLSDNALAVLKSRYFMDGEDWEQCCFRVASGIAAAEFTDDLKSKYTQAFYDEIHDMRFIPGGRILRNTGRARGSLLNCFNVPVGDSIEEIGQYLKDALTLWSDGGGVGTTFSSLRPKDAPILQKGGKSSGLVSFMEAADHVANTIESGGARRAAALGAVDVSHPEVLDFINAKLQFGKLSHFNISVLVTKDFLRAVEADADWEFRFNQRSFGKIKAREIWNKIVENMVKCAEPGILVKDNLVKNNSFYFDPVVGTNPCLAGDSEVLTTEGKKKIRQVVEEYLAGKNIEVVTYNTETGKTEIEPVVNAMLTKKNATLLEIELENGKTLKLTPDHKVFVEARGWVEAGNLNEDDEIIYIE